jgi:hypothetical protein
VMNQFADTEPALCARLTYIYNAQKRFYDMMAAWKRADMATVGALFRADGHGLRDDYAISGPELQTMCDVVRTVPGVLGERMLGGGDKGAAGALVRGPHCILFLSSMLAAVPSERANVQLERSLADRTGNAVGCPTSCVLPTSHPPAPLMMISRKRGDRCRSASGFRAAECVSG